MNKRRVVVTGLGVAACNGVGVDTFWRAIQKGDSGITLLDACETKDFSSKIAGQIRDFRPGEYITEESVRRVDRFVQFGLACSAMALLDSQLKIAEEDPERAGVIVGTGLGGVLFHEEQMVTAFERGALRLNPLSVPRISPNAVASHIAIRYGLRGSNLVITTACASGAQAIGEAFRKIQYGEIDLCFTGGVEAPLTPFNFGAYDALGLLSKANDNPASASRPFDRKRDGFVMSEGGAILILEERQRAIDRRAPILAELIGYACNSGAHHVVSPDPQGLDGARVMRAALKDAAVTSIDYINAHGISTKSNDSAETVAIKRVFGESTYRLPVSSTKSMIGHSLGASGAIEAVVCVKAIGEQFIPPTINFEAPDADCALDFVSGQGRSTNVNTVLSNSFGLGNCNVALVFAKAE